MKNMNEIYIYDRLKPMLHKVSYASIIHCFVILLFKCGGLISLLMLFSLYYTIFLVTESIPKIKDGK